MFEQVSLFGRDDYFWWIMYKDYSCHMYDYDHDIHVSHAVMRFLGERGGVRLMGFIDSAGWTHLYELEERHIMVMLPPINTLNIPPGISAYFDPLDVFNALDPSTLCDEEGTLARLSDYGYGELEDVFANLTV